MTSRNDRSNRNTTLSSSKIAVPPPPPTISTHQEQTTSVSGGYHTIVLDVDNCTTSIDGNNKSTIESKDCSKFTDANNVTAILERILLELELIRKAKEGNSTPEGKNANCT